jgi:hypothetical protein
MERVGGRLKRFLYSPLTEKDISLKRLKVIKSTWQSSL